MTLIDTSAWIHSLRRDGDPQVRARGITVPTVDLVVQACANHHGTSLLHADEHLRLLAEL